MVQAVIEPDLDLITCIAGRCLALDYVSFNSHVVGKSHQLFDPSVLKLHEPSQACTDSKLGSWLLDDRVDAGQVAEGC